MSHRQRRKRPGSSSSMVGSIVTTAAVAYGAYRAIDWAWNTFQDADGENEDDKGNLRQGSTTTGSSSSSWLPSSWMGSFSNPLQPPASMASPSTNPYDQLNPKTRWKLRKQRISKCRMETDKVLKTSLPRLKEMIESVTDTSRDTKKLKELRKQCAEWKKQQQQQQQQQQETTQMDEKETAAAMDDNPPIDIQGLEAQQEELWQRVIQKTITRLFASTFAGTLLYLSLTMQIHWVGGKMMKSSFLQQSFEADHTSSSHEQQQQQAQTYHQKLLVQSHSYFFQQGLPWLLDTIQRTIQTTVDWKATQYLTISDIHHVFETIHNQLLFGNGSEGNATENKKSPKKYPRNWIAFVLPKHFVATNTDDDVNGGLDDCCVHNIGVNDDDDDDDVDDIDCLWDIASSPIWEDAQAMSLNTLMHHLQKCNYSGSNVAGWEVSSFAKHAAQEELQQTPQPMAKLIAPFQHACNLILQDSKSNALYSLATLPTVIELGDVSFQ